MNGPMASGRHGSSAAGRSETSLRTRVALVAVLLVSAAVVWRPLESVEIAVSDSVEYAMAARRLIDGDGLTVDIRGLTLPTRYSPGFPVLFIAPVYFLVGGPDELAIMAVEAAAVAALLCFWFLARDALPGPWGTAAAAVCVLAVGHLFAFQRHSAALMSDVPLLAVSLFAAVAFVRCFRSPSRTVYFFGGLMTAVACTMRLTSVALALPFLLLLLRRRSSWRAWCSEVLAFGLPVATGIGAVLLYQAETFGCAFFTGYQYWLPESAYSLDTAHFEAAVAAFLRPYGPPMHIQDVPSWTGVANALLALPLLSGALCLRFAHSEFRRTGPILVFFALGALPILAFFLVYPFAYQRFFLVVHALWLALGVAWTLALVSRRVGPKPVAALIGVTALVAACWLRPWNDLRKTPFQRAALECADRLLPDDAVILGGVHELQGLYHLVRGTERTLLPLRAQRSFEAWKVGACGEERLRIGVPSVQTDPSQVADALEGPRPVYLLAHDARWAGYQAQVDALLQKHMGHLVGKVDKFEVLYRLELAPVER